MKSLVQKLCLLSLAVLIALPLAAQDKEKKKGKKKDGRGEIGQISQIKEKIASLELTDEQKKKIEATFAEYTPKFKDAMKGAGDAPRQIQQARKKLSADGKKGKELAAAVKDEVKLTDEQQAAVDKLSSLGQELRSAVSAVLTDEQREKAGLNAGKGKKKKKNA